ncbi:uncharacterized protein UTRI_00682 [Ustilago trichophora]|uniref:Uncharacterized protein n=1 Tax=Ustilago trichophora TaxID=86804 RepID=A0A5C3DS50_9BASI|nr:uncharacterized protein UTRI_00682 [Ustilago trichophora]
MTEQRRQLETRMGEDLVAQEKQKGSKKKARIFPKFNPIPCSNVKRCLILPDSFSACDPKPTSGRVLFTRLEYSRGSRGKACVAGARFDIRQHSQRNPQSFLVTPPYFHLTFTSAL